MAATPENKVKEKVVAILKYFGAYYFFPSTGGYGRSGVPDVIACYRGYFIAIEVKAGNNTPTALQQRELRRVAKARGIAMWVNEDTVDSLHDRLNLLSEGAEHVT